MKETRKFYYFKKATEEELKKLATFNKSFTAGEFEELEQKAKAEFKAQEINAKHGTKNFDNEAAFTSSGINGFYFPSAELQNPETGYRLLVIAFNRFCGWDFVNKCKGKEEIKPIAIYTDSNEQLYFRRNTTLDYSPLQGWQKELQDSVNDAENQVFLWQQVKRCTKKDGGDFANVNKNFENATITVNYDGTLKIDVHGHTGAKWASDTIYSTPQNPLKTVNDVMPAIAERIKYLENYAATKKAILEKSDKIYDDVFGAIFEKIIKYQTPSNDDGLQIDYFYSDVKNMLNKIYLSNV